ncbi:histidine phosphatase family protein [Chelatococcus sp. SYSU_G07232]|uniref:Histidine phosphatase family protein n=1 Tax=Chelatococcus albus TaxID=3047466 RepID=A0ABT7AF65_9HYPH|nr:histidine phosphatase family protein [Chelatococcus sp. SYSU_G07232]MDJ1158010.1 histidine phosphatase family protein [Chelatococcus sp. SYSU_G07232]
MKKIIHCIRHGQSTFNALFEVTQADPLHFDAPLSALGHEQVRTTAPAVADTHYELVVTSPLTRALQTTLGLFGGHPQNPPILVEALHREHLANSCDVGRPPSVLARDFPELTFGHLDEVWWHNDGAPDERGIHVEPIAVVEERAHAFRAWLAARPERSIAVVGHGTFFFHLMGHRFANCEIVAFDL